MLKVSIAGYPILNVFEALKKEDIFKHINPTVEIEKTSLDTMPKLEWDVQRTFIAKTYAGDDAHLMLGWNINKMCGGYTLMIMQGYTILAKITGDLNDVEELIYTKYRLALKEYDDKKERKI